MRSLFLYLLLPMALAACNGSGSSAKLSLPAPSGEANGPAALSAPATAGDSDQELVEIDPDVPVRPEAMLVGHLLENGHLRRMALDDAVSKQAFARFIKMLDGRKLFLLAEHVEALERHVTAMDDQMKQGRLALAEEAAVLLKERAAVIGEIVQSHLAKPLDFSTEEYLETDSDKVDFVATEAELAERWHRVVKYDVLQRLSFMDQLAKRRAEGGAHGEAHRKIPAEPKAREAQARKEVATGYEARFARVDKSETQDQVALFINAIAGIYDPHTLYLPPVSRENFDIQMSGSLEGIGALLAERDHYVRVEDIVPGSASWRQGELETGDMVLAVAQGKEPAVDIADMPINDVVSLIRGQKGTEVTLTVQKPDDRIIEITLVRDVVQVEAAYAKGGILEHKDLKQPVGYIDLPSFYGNTRAAPGSTPKRNSAGDVRTLLDTFRQQGVDAVVLDLRGNGGGLLDDARVMSGLFLETGPIVQTQFIEGLSDVLYDRDPEVSFDGNVVVLVNRASASASEIVAAALQDYGRAVVVGTGATHGKGTVQMLVDLDMMAQQSGMPNAGGMGVLKLTRQQFFRVDGSSTQHRGVVPDIPLPDPAAHIESGERSLEHSIPWSRVEPLQFVSWPYHSWDFVELNQRSKARQAKNEAFAMVEKRFELLQKLRENTREPLKRDVWEAKETQQREEILALEKEADDDRKRFEVAVIDYDNSFDEQVRPRGADKRGAAGAKAKPDAEPVPSRLQRWQQSVASDPWLEEALLVVGDMRQQQRTRRQAGAGAGAKQ